MPRIVRLILYILRFFFLIDDIIERDAQPRGPLIQMWRVQVWRQVDGDKSFRLFFLSQCLLGDVGGDCSLLSNYISI